MTEIMQYNENNYRDYEQYRGFAVIRFYATWCAPCMQNYAVFEQLTTMFGQHIKFGKVNVDQAPILTLRLAARMDRSGSQPKMVPNHFSGA